VIISSRWVARAVVVGLRVAKRLAIDALAILLRHDFKLSFFNLDLAAQLFLTTQLVNFIFRAHGILHVRRR